MIKEDGYFVEKNFFQKMILDQKTLEEYYRNLRKYELETDAPIRNKEYFEKNYQKAIKIIAFYMKFLRKIKIHKDLRTFSTGRPKVYAVTHIGRYDIEASALTRKEQAVYLWGDPGKLYKSPEKILIDLLGANFIDTDYREDCHVGLEKTIRYLQNIINNQYNPEGAWNILPNKVVMRLYDGASIAAIEGNADLVPCAIQQYGKNIYISYGKEMDTSNLCLEDVKETTAKLRDEMATLAWDLVRNYSGEVMKLDDEEDFVYTAKRKTLPDDAYERFVHSIMKDTDNGYGIEEIEKTRYKDKNHPEPQEIEKDLEEYINYDPLFYMASSERFANYIEVCQRKNEIINCLEDFRKKETNQNVLPIEERLKRYKSLKNSK